MKRAFLLEQAVTMLIFLSVFTSCNGQVKNEVRKIKEGEEQRNVDSIVKIPKPAGVYQDASIGFGISDKKGNTWFASNGEGVFCYNGKYFVQFTMTEGLNSNVAYSIAEDSGGNIWVGTNKGLNRLNGNRFENISMDLKPGKSSFSNYFGNRSTSPTGNKVWSMVSDRKGVLWLGTDDGVYCFNGKDFTRFLDDQNIINKDSLKLKAIFSILETADGSIWFTACQSEGISRLRENNLQNIIPYKNVGRTDKVLEDKKGNLWFACVFNGVGRYDGKTFIPNVFNEKAGHGPSNIVKDGIGNIWFNTQDGLGYYDGTKLHIMTEKSGTIVKDFIPIHSDKAGNLWFSSTGMKLYKYDGKTFTKQSEQ